MSELAWNHVIESVLSGQGRAQPPRSSGITMVIDKGLGLAATADLLEIGGSVIDHWKCTFGTSAFVPAEVLRRKLLLLASHNILTYPGGTLLEVAIVQGHCRAFMQQAHQLGFSAVEISDGTIPLPATRRRNVIRCALEQGLTPITEVGKKDPTRQVTARELAEQALQDLEWGAQWVILEARESGKGIGIYDEHGAVRVEAVTEICELMGTLVSRLIWEAPLKDQQVYLIRQFGPNVNLGNIFPGEVLALEALRTGLRFETFARVAEALQRSGQWRPEEIEAREGEGNEPDRKIAELQRER